MSPFGFMLPEVPFLPLSVLKYLLSFLKSSNLSYGTDLNYISSVGKVGKTNKALEKSSSRSKYYKQLAT